LSGDAKELINTVAPKPLAEKSALPKGPSIMRIRAGLLTILLLAACSADDTLDTDSNSTAQTTPARELRLGEKRWVPLSSRTPVAPYVTLSGDELMLRLGGYYVESATLKGEKYVRISVPERSAFSDVGMPDLPTIRVNVPSSPATEAAIKVIGQTSESVASDPPLPSRGEITRGIDPDTVPYAPSQFYRNGGTFPAKNVELGPAFFLRDMHGVPVQFQPFQYDAKAKSLPVYSEIRVRLTGAVDGRQVQRREAAFESVYESAFGVESTTEADPPPSSYPNVAEPGRLLIITADEYADAVAPLVDWKTRRGVDTTVKRMSEVGTTAAAVQSFIQTEFDSAKSLTYVILLVGDANAIPTLKGGRERADCDACFAMVKGGDYYPDLFISRISGRTVGQIETQVAKFVTYERHPDPQVTGTAKLPASLRTRAARSIGSAPKSFASRSKNTATRRTLRSTTRVRRSNRSRRRSTLASVSSTTWATARAGHAGPPVLPWVMWRRSTTPASGRSSSTSRARTARSCLSSRRLPKLGCVTATRTRQSARSACTPHRRTRRGCRRP
jgi:hypothetical protein